MISARLRLSALEPACRASDSAFPSLPISRAAWAGSPSAVFRLGRGSPSAMRLRRSDSDSGAGLSVGAAFSTASPERMASCRALASVERPNAASIIRPSTSSERSASPESQRTELSFEADSAGTEEGSKPAASEASEAPDAEASLRALCCAARISRSISSVLRSVSGEKAAATLPSSPASAENTTESPVSWL